MAVGEVVHSSRSISIRDILSVRRGITRLWSLFEPNHGTELGTQIRLKVDHHDSYVILLPVPFWTT
jgi:hypothetical protein